MYAIFSLIKRDTLVQQKETVTNNTSRTTTSPITPSSATSSQKVETKKEAKSAEVVVQNLSIPWELVFLPEREMLVTERAGKLLRIGVDKKVIEISGVAHRGEGGLLGLTLHPKFKENKYIYIYLTTLNGSKLANRVERYVLNGTSLSDRVVIIENIPGANYHDGGRIAFGPDGMLYITTGDAGDTNNSQNKNSLAGKILRVTDDGKIPSDNPFGTAVYSYGNRNVQGIAWDKTGQMWATEHGRSGVLSGYDEVNKIIKGENYGWPDIQGDETKEGMITPSIHSGPKDTWAPSGMTYFKDRLLFAGLRGQAVYSAKVSNGKIAGLQTFFKKEYGRLRTVVLGPDGMLYILTNNRDSLGKPIPSDDRIIKIDPKSFGIF
jgi:glucose/arabinose dehydrogenase